MNFNNPEIDIGLVDQSICIVLGRLADRGITIKPAIYPDSWMALTNRKRLESNIVKLTYVQKKIVKKKVLKKCKQKLTEVSP